MRITQNYWRRVSIRSSDPCTGEKVAAMIWVLMMLMVALW